MDKLIEGLLNIEQNAIASLAELDEERVIQTRLTQAEIARLMQQITHTTNLAIEDIKNEAKASLAVELAALESEYQQKAAHLQELFTTNAEPWQMQWVSHVLDIPESSS
ncbi:MAG: hypothetical protein FWC92_01960 [Defluviitaleaceae bacterium]|nr:hypothetical protein [Defluviitaleaceae bacterium]